MQTHLLDSVNLWPEFRYHGTLHRHHGTLRKHHRSHLHHQRTLRHHHYTEQRGSELEPHINNHHEPNRLSFPASVPGRTNPHSPRARDM